MVENNEQNESQEPQYSRRDFLIRTAQVGLAVGAAGVATAFESKLAFAGEIYNNNYIEDEWENRNEPEAGHEGQNPESFWENVVPGTMYEPGQVVSRGDPTIKTIFLTIDDDWRYVSTIMDIADQKGVKVTFCPVGQAVNKNKTLYQEVLQRGFTIENHTWNHKDLNKLTAAEVTDEIVKQRDLVQNNAAAAGIDYKEVFLRPPYGHANPTVQGVARDLGLVIVKWDISSVGDSKKPTEDKVYHNVVNHLKNGAIVLQHAVIKDLDVLPHVIETIKSQGYDLTKSLRDGIPTTIYTPNS